MTDEVTVKIEGLEQFNRKIEELIKSCSQDVSDPILLEGAQAIRDEAKRRAPKGDTGNLIKGIKAALLKRRLHSSAAVARSTAPHSHLVEYGTAPRKQKTTGRYTGAMPAHPFFRPAVDSTLPRVAQDIIRKLENKIKNVH